MARGKIADPFTSPAAVGAFTVWGGCTPAPCPLNYHSRQFPDSSRRIFSEFPRSSFCSRVPHGFKFAARIRQGSRRPQAVRQLPQAPQLPLRCVAPISMNYSPSKLLGDSPFEKSAVYIKAACPRFHSIYSQKLKGRGLYIPLFLCQKRGVF